MSDLSPEERLARHRAVLQWLEYQVGQELKEIAKLEAEISEKRRRKKVAYRESRFTVEYTWSDDTPDILHRGACEKYHATGDHLQAAEAALMMRERHLVTCPSCNPGPALAHVRLPPVIPDEGA